MNCIHYRFSVQSFLKSRWPVHVEKPELATPHQRLLLHLSMHARLGSPTNRIETHCHAQQPYHASSVEDMLRAQIKNPSMFVILSKIVPAIPIPP